MAASAQYLGPVTVFQDMLRASLVGSGAAAQLHASPAPAATIPEDSEATLESDQHLVEHMISKVRWQRGRDCLCYVWCLLQ